MRIKSPYILSRAGPYDFGPCGDRTVTLSFHVTWPSFSYRRLYQFVVYTILYHTEAHTQQIDTETGGVRSVL